MKHCMENFAVEKGIIKTQVMKKEMMLASSLLCLASAKAQETTPMLDEPEKTPMEELEERTGVLEEKVSKLSNIKLSGYIQAQYQYAQEKGSTKVGNHTNEKNGTENDGDGYGRFGIRRGRLKATYEKGLSKAVFELDITEKGVFTKNAYFSIKDPWAKTNSLQFGVFDRPFGYEIGYSSSTRESPEYSTLCNKLFPDEREVGAMLTLAPKKTSPLSLLKLQAGVFAGNGLKQESNSRLDFIGKLSAKKNIGSNGDWELGVSYYNGGVYQGTKNVFEMDGDAFVADTSASNIGKYAKRQYVGFDGAINYASNIGMTKLMAEFVFGQQPGTEKDSKSPNDSNNGTSDTYIRNFNGWYVMLVQDLGQSPLSVVAKYDYYDANTDLKKDKVGQNGSGKADLAQSTIGAGLLWRVMSNFRLTAYYEWNKNEQSKNVAGYDKDVKDNLFTLRAQYKF